MAADSTVSTDAIDHALLAELQRDGRQSIAELAHAEQHLKGLLRGLIAEAAKVGQVRDDVPPDELASYCVHALTAAGRLPSKPAVRRLVTTVLSGLRRS